MILDKIIRVNREKVSPAEFNNIIKKMIEKFNPNVIFSYGCQKISKNFIKKNIRFLNIHGGILPYYRGVNTNFWPHFNNDSNKVGLTLHEINKNIDGGDIFFQESANITKKDNINTLSCKSIKNFSLKVPKKISTLLKTNFHIKGIKQKKIYNAFKKKDFKPKYIAQARLNLNNYKKLKKKFPKDFLINIF